VKDVKGCKKERGRVDVDERAHWTLALERKRNEGKEIPKKRPLLARPRAQAKRRSSQVRLGPFRRKENPRSGKRRLLFRREKGGPRIQATLNSAPGRRLWKRAYLGAPRKKKRPQRPFVVKFRRPDKETGPSAGKGKVIRSGS